MALSLDRWNWMCCESEIITVSRARCTGAESCWSASMLPAETWRIASNKCCVSMPSRYYWPLILAPGSTNISSVRPSFEIPTEHISDWLKVDLVHNRAVWRNLFLWHWTRRVNTMVLGVTAVNIFFHQWRKRNWHPTQRNASALYWLYQSSLMICNVQFLSTASFELNHFRPKSLWIIRLPVVRIKFSSLDICLVERCDVFGLSFSLWISSLTAAMLSSVRDDFGPWTDRFQQCVQSNRYRPPS